MATFAAGSAASSTSFNAAAQVPGFDPGGTALIAASAAGFSNAAADGLALTWRPADIVAAFT